jgi:uncharacterized protein (TIGR03083 family)
VSAPSSQGRVHVEDVPEIAPPESVRLAAAETARMHALLAALDTDEWRRPTDCPAWDVRALAGHVLGMTEGFTSLRRMATGMIAATRRAGDGPVVDALTALQVEKNSALDVPELLRRMEVAGPAQARWRGRARLVRPMPSKEEINGAAETWRMAFILDVILTRDTWMHRVDVAYATGRELALTPEHDGRLVAHVVAEWGRRHGRPFALHLTGPAGGTFLQGDWSGRGEQITLDAVEFCRTLSGRAEGQGLLATEVPF